MMHDEVEALLGAYALHATTAEETARVDAHLVSCPRCRAEVAAHEEVAAMLGTSAGEAPAGLWEKISSSLPRQVAGGQPPRPDLPARPLAGQDPVGPRVVPTQRGARDRSPRDRSPSRRWRATVVAAGAVAAAVIGFLGAQVADLQSQVHTLDQAMGAQKVLEGPHLTVQLTSAAHAPAATVVVAPSGSAYWLASNLPALAPSRTYQMWGLVRGKPVSLGLIGPRPGSVSAFRVEANVTALMVTAEPQGGTPAPTTAVVAQGIVRRA